MLFRKMIRDMKNHKMQFLSILLMAFLGVFVFTGIGGEYIGLERTVNDYYEETNLADIWVYGTSFSEEDIEKLEALDIVEDVDRRKAIPTISPKDKDAFIDLYSVDTNNVSMLYTVTGEVFSNQGDGIWLDDRFAKANGYQLGDEITLSIEGNMYTKTIKGTVYSPEYVFMENNEGAVPDFTKAGYAYVPKEALSMIPYTQLLITTSVEDVNSIEKTIVETITSQTSVYLSRDNVLSYTTFNAEVEQHKALGAIFPVVFLIVALLTMLTTMTRIVNNQRTQIGTLKALGFKNRKIMRHYIYYGFFLSTIGSVLGALLGPILLPPLFYPSMSSFYTIPSWQPAYDISFYIMMVVTIILTTLTTYIACRQVLKERPAKTLRPKAPKHARKGILEKLPFWNKVSFITRWNYRDILRNKVRSLMAIVGVLGCTSLLIGAFGMKTDMDDLKVWQYEKINQFSTKLLIDETATLQQRETARKKADGEFVLEGAVELKTEDMKKSGSITVLDNVSLLTYTDVDINPMTLPKEGISISAKMADELQVDMGDTIQWHIYGDTNWHTSKIAAIYRHPTSQGIAMHQEYYTEQGYVFTPTAILSKQVIEDKDVGITSIIDSKTLATSWEDLTEAMMLMVIILIIAAIVLAIVVLYNLGILSLTEMQRDLATLKVVGFKTKILQKLMLVQNIWLSIIGFIIGVPLGKILIDRMIASMGSSMDMTNFIQLPTVLISLCIVLGLAFLVNIMFYRKLKNINMVEALKGVE